MFWATRGNLNSTTARQLAARITRTLPWALVLTTGFLLTGCDVEPIDPVSCSTENGYLEVCATLYNEPADGHALVRSSSDDEVPLEALLDESGCTTIELEPGQYEWAAAALSDNCVSLYEEVTVAGCAEVSEVSVALEYWCQDGR